MNPLELLIIQPTPFCNIDCDYCYLPTRTDSRTMSFDVLTAVFDTAFRTGALGDDLTVVWHGGEPLAAPLDFYERAHDLVAERRPKNCEVTFSFQTNGLLLTEAWCAFLKRSNSRIGLSIDGPAHIHDAQRRYRSGRGTHAGAMRAVSLLNEHTIDFHVISVVTSLSLSHPNELYEFIRSLGCSSWAFNIEALQGTNRRRSFCSTENDEEIRRFVKALFTTWLSDNERLRIREFDGLVSALMRGQVGTRQDARPFAILNVDVEGNVSTFSPELLGHDTHHGKFFFGNLARDDLKAVADDPRLRAVTDEIRNGIEKCRSTCSYFSLCGGGTPSSKFFETGRFDISRTRDCETQRMILIDEVVDVLEAKAEQRLGVRSGGPRTSVKRNETLDLSLSLVPVLLEAPLSKQLDMLEVSFGTRAAGGTQLCDEYADRATIPQVAWQGLTDDVREKIVTAVRGTRPRCGVFTLDRQLFDSLTYLIEEFPPERVEEEGIPHNLFDGVVDYLDRRFDAQENSAVHGATWDTPGRDTVTVDREIAKFIGLHLDSWDGVSFADRDRSRTRLCFNLGPDVRSFLYVPVRLRDAAKAIASSSNAEITLRDLVPRFFSVFPRFPVVRINLPPGTGYFADTDNLIHDGSSALARKPSLHFTMRGRYAAI